MKADLYTAHARTAGSSGLAHRTAAGFVVLTSADGDDVIALIDAKQNESDLIDQVVAAVQTNGPASFAMLFTAGGDLYAIASGDAAVTIASPSMHATIRATADHVFVQQLGAALNEADANVRLHVGDVPAGARTTLDLQAGTVEATWLEIVVGDAVIFVDTDVSAAEGAGPSTDASAAAPAAAPLDTQPATPPETPTPETPTPETGAPPASTPEMPAPPEPAPPVPQPAPATLAAPAVPEPTVPQPQPVPATPLAPDDPEIEPVAIMAPDDAGSPADEPLASSLPKSTITPPPTPTATPSPAAAPGRVGAAMVLGVACSQGHHNHPDAVYCSQCGTKMGVHHTTVLINGPRPPLGVLVVDDGTTYSLNEDLVIGREPTSHDDVVAGTASPMILTDDTLSLSRKHARIVLDDWSVAVQDLNSSNGTFLSRAGQAETWSQVEPWSTTLLEPGDRLRVGGRIIQVELHHVR